MKEFEIFDTFFFQSPTTVHSASGDFDDLVREDWSARIVPLCLLIQGQPFSFFELDEAP